MDKKVISIDPEIVKEAREQADFLLTKLKARNPDSGFPAELIEKTYSTLYSIKRAKKKLVQE